MRLRDAVPVSGLVMFASTATAQTASMPAADELKARFSFEGGATNGTPRGWGGGPAGTIFLEETTVHSGKGAARLERDEKSTSAFSPIALSIPVEFSGSTLELKAFLRTESVQGGAALWLREDGETGPVAFDNMAGRQLSGTNPWASFSIQLPLKAEARTIVFGALLSGTGKVWLDDVELLVDGKPVWEAPRIAKAPTILDADHEFDRGSKIALTDLTEEQTGNLATLGQVWGFLKYHHPAVREGRVHWDYELFRVMPRVLAAASRTAALAAIDDWVAGLGSISPCSPCASLDLNTAHLRPDIEWLGDASRLGASLSARLRSIHANRLATGKQFYVSLAPGVSNPVFDRELAYANAVLPDAGFQILALFRFWNIVEYLSPYRDVIGEPWDGVLRRFIPRMALATTREAYQLELMALIASFHDTHANLWSSLDTRPPVGNCHAPATFRWVEENLVVTAVLEEKEGSGLRAGDVILEMDGVPVPNWVARWRPYYAASNEPSMMRDMARQFTQGSCGAMPLRVRRGAETFNLTSSRTPGGRPEGRTHDVPGDTFRRLSDKIAYLKLSSVKAAEAARYVEAAAGTTGLIIDIRNYPSEFVVFALGSLLVDGDTPFARFTRADLENPGAFLWDGGGTKLEPGKPHYGGKVVILVDEVTLSQAEYTSMAFRASPRAIVIGSTTAGADGNVSSFPLPGGLRTMISGIGVFYPDKRPTQRVGIIPDVEVRPSIAGIRAGRDEVLEEAIHRILGATTPRSEIEALVNTAYGREH